MQQLREVHKNKSAYRLITFRTGGKKGPSDIGFTNRETEALKAK